METLIRAICQKEGLPAHEIRPLSGGQVNQVYVVDAAYVVRIGGRADAYRRLQLESDLLRRLEGKASVAKVYAFGTLDETVYQIQAYIPGQMLYRVWKERSASQQDAIVADLASQMQAVHALGAPAFGDPRQPASQFSVWGDFLENKFQHTLTEIAALKIRMAPGFIELASDYFQQHKHTLQSGTPTVTHSDLTLVNLLVTQDKIAALLDFEYAMQAPADYDLWVMEAFCLYPNDWAEEGNEVYCSADFAGFIPLLQKHYPQLFAIEHLRERVNLYQLDAALGSYLAWRKDNLSTIPPERMAAKEFYMSKITNFIFAHGARMF